MQFDVVSIGEILIDFIPLESGKTIEEVSGFHKHAGGAPANTIVGLARLGAKVAFVSSIANDPFGKFLFKTLQQNRVDTGYCVIKDGTKTPLAFVSHAPDKERSFVFYRERTADTRLCLRDIDMSVFANSRIVFFNTNILRARNTRKIVLKGIKLAKKNQRLVFFDPNIRLHLWEKKNSILAIVKKLLKYIDIIRMNREEFDILGLKPQFYINKGVKLLILTDNEKNIEIHTRNLVFTVPVPPTETVDTTGAGDAFNAGILFEILKIQNLDNLNKQQIKNIIDMGIRAARIVVQRPGALDSMPYLSEISL